MTSTFLRAFTGVVFALFIFLSRAEAIIPFTSPSALVKVDASCWNFRDKAELERVIAKWQGNPRASYYIINAARRKRLALPAALAYIKLSQKGLNSKNQVVAGYACMVATGRFSLNLRSKISDDTTTAMSYFNFVYGMLDDAAREKNASAEILIMIAACKIEAQSGLVPPSTQWPAILKIVRRGQRLAPRWADAYYWYAVALDMYGEGLGKNANRPLSMARGALYRAKRLDPGMSASCLRLLGLVAEDQKRYKEALVFIDKWLALEPQARTSNIAKMWRERVVRASMTQQQN